MAYEFSRFSPQSFERFVQALAVAVCGGRVQVYGAGADGAREATFEGRCEIGACAWDGYVVFQAKHRQHLGEPGDNADWLIKQIDAEFAKFADARRALRRPDYYVLASNVRLSAGAANAKGQREGGVDRVSRHLAATAQSVGIRETVLWHQDSLASLLDVNPGLRTAFDFWIQPGDVLAAVLRRLGGPDREDVLVDYLAESLRQGREIKTKDVGQAIGRTVNLDEVFVDLPVRRGGGSRSGTDQLVVADLEELEATELAGVEEVSFESIRSATVVAELMLQAADRLSPSDGDRRAAEGGGAGCRPSRGRVVLLGGPGQGKSTVGQFVAQLCRARLLASFEDRHSPETMIAVEAVLARARAEGIPLDGPLRYPFHVELPRYADRLSAARADGENVSILGHLAARISVETEQSVSAKALSGWLGAIPSVIILDGLDEVPASGNRGDVVAAIERVMDALQAERADCLVFVTSRPQGYREELRKDLWGHWRLSALEPQEALRLTGNVAPVLVADAARRDEILGILAGAAEEAATAPLLTSPLQVMLLFQLVATRNNIPKDRWTLFQRHYEMLRDREISKGGVSGNTIRDFQQQIDGIHADAGFLLHLRAEAAGHADAHLTLVELSSMVRDRLEKDEFPGDLSALTERIVGVATERLVFLRSQVEGQVAFDVRSLQEFMAAVRLTSGPPAKLIERLTMLAGRSHWSHVLRIAASRILGSAEYEWLRDGLIGMLDSLDRADRCEDDRLVRIGSRIALQLLVDGTAGSVPALERKLAARAFNLVEVFDRAAHWELSVTMNAERLPSLATRLLELLNGGGRVERNGALRFLLLASGSDESPQAEAMEGLLLEHWPDQPSEVFRLLDGVALVPARPALVDRLRTSQYDATPTAVQWWLSSFVDEDDEADLPPGTAVVAQAKPPVEIPLVEAESRWTDFAFTFQDLSSARMVDGPPADASPRWRLAAASGAFSSEPGIRTATAFLGEAAAVDLASMAIRPPLPWLLEALVAGADAEALARRSEALAKGEYGGPAEWEAAEVRWRAGMDPAGIAAAATAPLAAHGVGLALPRLTGRRIRQNRGVVAAGDALRVLAGLLPEADWALVALLLYLDRTDGDLPVDVVDLIRRLPASALEIAATRSVASSTMVRKAACSDAPDAVDWLVRIFGRYPKFVLSGRRFEDAVAVVARHPQLRSLLPALARNARMRMRRWRIDGVDVEPILGPLCRSSSDDPVEVRGAAAVLRVVGRVGDAREDGTVETLLEWRDAPLDMILNDLTRGDQADPALSAAISRKVLSLARLDWAERAQSALLQFVEALPAGFQDPVLSEALSLPRPLAGWGAATHAA